MYLPADAPGLNSLAGPWAIDPGTFYGLLSLGPRTVAAAATGPAPGVERRAVGRVAVLSLTGVMTKGGSRLGPGTVELRGEVRRAAADPNVSAILLVIDSPGGTVAGTGDLAAEVLAAKAVKPVYAQVDDLCASAAYWVASQCDKVFANNNTALVGSIGTFLTLYDLSAKAEKDGVKALHFATGPLKGAGAPGTPIADDQKAYFQGIVEAGQRVFDDAVARGRGFTPARLAAVRTGGVFGAAEAARLGLIDCVQSFDATAAALRSVTKS